MDQKLQNRTGSEFRPEAPGSEASIGTVYGVSLVVPMLLCCLLPLFLSIGIGTVVGAAGSWLAGVGGIQIAAGAVVVGGVGYGLVRWRRTRLHRPATWPHVNCQTRFRETAEAESGSNRAGSSHSWKMPESRDFWRRSRGGDKK